MEPVVKHSHKLPQRWWFTQCMEVEWNTKQKLFRTFIMNIRTYVVKAEINVMLYCCLIRVKPGCDYHRNSCLHITHILVRLWVKLLPHAVLKLWNNNQMLLTSWLMVSLDLVKEVTTCHDVSRNIFIFITKGFKTESFVSTTETYSILTILLYILITNFMFKRKL